ncbi:MAG TPA: HhoA/HhoB/HtrA family serine endopeptidase [Elainellaceae cyanobacterium]
MIMRLIAIALGVILILSPMRGLTNSADAMPLSRENNRILLSLTGARTAYSVQTGSDVESASTLIAQVPSQSRSFVASAVERVGASVVRIDTERTITRQLPGPLNDPFFRQFFGGDEITPSPSFEQRLQGQGSGFIIDSEGIILTNAHVVDRADRVTILLKDGRTFDGEVRGVDEVTDLAVVKIDADQSGLPVAPLGDSDDIQVGDWAIAVGNPLGLDNTVTLGIVSTLNRSSAIVGIPDKRIDFIQTDAAINPGNSGGPLLNDRGEVIGINTAIRANANGIGFAIPINKAKDISAQLVQGERVSHPYLGVQITTLTPDLATENNGNPNASIILPEIDGVLITGIVPDSPAAASGLRRGDVITQINGQSLTSAQELQNFVENSGVGQRLRVTIRRGDRTQQLSVQTAQLPSGDR